MTTFGKRKGSFWTCRQCGADLPFDPPVMVDVECPECGAPQTIYEAAYHGSTAVVSGWPPFGVVLNATDESEE